MVPGFWLTWPDNIYDQMRYQEPCPLFRAESMSQTCLTLLLIYSTILISERLERTFTTNSSPARSGANLSRASPSTHKRYLHLLHHSLHYPSLASVTLWKLHLSQPPHPPMRVPSHDTPQQMKSPAYHHSYLAATSFWSYSIWVLGWWNYCHVVHHWRQKYFLLRAALGSGVLTFSGPWSLQNSSSWLQETPSGCMCFRLSMLMWMLVICLWVTDKVQMVLYFIVDWYVVSDIYVYKCRCNFIAECYQSFLLFPHKHHTTST